MSAHNDSSTPHKDSGKPHKWASVIKAWADGKAIEYFDEGSNSWIGVSLGTAGPWSHPDLQWRIKPERWYRVALMCNSSGEWIYATTREQNEIDAEGHGDFVRWLTERIYY